MMVYELFRRGVLRPQWYWRLKAVNGRAIACSGEGYHNEADARHAIDLVKGSTITPVEIVER